MREILIKALIFQIEIKIVPMKLDVLTDEHTYTLKCQIGMENK